MRKNWKNPALITALCATVLLAAVSGCGTMPHDTAHVYRFDATGNKLAVSQNPVTGFYELGWQRVQTEYTQVPVIWTNGQFYIPETLMRYEVNTHSAVFGNAAMTSTLGTGSNAVNTRLGGGADPINAATGTGNNLTPISH